MLSGRVEELSALLAEIIYRSLYLIDVVNYTLSNTYKEPDRILCTLFIDDGSSL